MPEPGALVRELTKTRDARDVVDIRAARVLGKAPQRALSAETVAARLNQFPGWELYPAGPGLARLYYFPSAGDAAAFAVYVAGLLADLEVDPSIELQGSMVSVRVWTLSGRGQVTERDLDLVALVEGRGEVPR